MGTVSHATDVSNLWPLPTNASSLPNHCDKQTPCQIAPKLPLVTTVVPVLKAFGTYRNISSLPSFSSFPFSPFVFPHDCKKWEQGPGKELYLCCCVEWLRKDQTSQLPGALKAKACRISPRTYHQQGKKSPPSLLL